MNESHFFWIPAVLRVLVLLVIGSLVGAFASIWLGFAIIVIGMVMLIMVQLRYLFRLSKWLDAPESHSLPDGWGAWSEVFSRLYRLRREDENNRRQLTEWLTRFRQTMHLLPDGVAIMDDALFLEWCNPAAEAHLGLQQVRDEGRRVTNLVRHPAFIDYMNRGVFDGPLHLNLRERELIIRIIPFESRRQILVSHDATEVERAAVMRRDFVANASHELRTPLTVINGFLEIAESQPNLDPATRIAHTRLMLEQGQRMQHLIDDMLTLTRLESIALSVRAEPVPMREMIASVIQDAELLSNGRHTIVADIAGPDLNGNVDELRSALSNLLSNAVRYTPDHGTIHVTWKALTSASGEKDGAVYIVKDNGIGIEPEHITRLTERFYRVDKSRSRETKGTGLGLAIVKHVLLRHDATLSIESVPGEGSTFSVKFPVKHIVTEI